MAWLVRLFWAALALLVFFFAALAVNQDEIALKFLNWQSPPASVFWWLLGALGLGLVTGFGGATLLSMKQRLANRRLTKDLEARDSELKKLRSING